MKHANQVEDDPELLDQMLRDTDSAPYIYKPTNHWDRYNKRMIQELKSIGLHDFRRRKNSILVEFGASDLELIDRVLSLHEGLFPPSKLKLLKILLRTFKIKPIEKLLFRVMRSYYGLSPTDFKLFLYQFAKYYGQAVGARPISDFSISSIGNPDGVFTVDGNRFTLGTVQYYLPYAYCCKFCDFDAIESVMEIGSGGGKQIEMLKKLHPHLTFYVFDIPPQLYICEQYLSALFPDSVVSYNKTREFRNIPEEREGKIFILGTWKLPQLENFNYDLFWNFTSFQEMEPPVVLNFLNFVNRQVKKFVFLSEHMEGMPIAKKKGEYGVLEKVTLEHYKKGLKDFEILDMSHAPDMTGYEPDSRQSFWKRSNCS